MLRDKYLFITVIVLINTLLCATTYALPNDREQSIHLQANKSSFDQKNGIIIYAGSAQLQQGSLVIKAEEIIVYYAADKTIEKIEASGTPAHLQQKPDIDQNLVTASADKILYSHNENTVELLENAQLTQAGATMHGYKIYYDLTRELIRAEGGDGSEHRIKMTIPANTLAQ